MKKSLIGLAAVIIVAGAVVGGIELANSPSSGGNASVVAAGTSVSQTSPAATPASPSAAPTHLTSVSAINVDFLPAGVEQYTNGTLNGTVYRSFSLPGKANTSTVPASGITADNAATVHVATRLILYAEAGATAIPDEVTAGYGDGFTQTWTTVQGAKALITQRANGYGTLRIDWVGNDGVYYTVITQRLDTPDGLSGLDEATMLQIANGVSASGA